MHNIMYDVYAEKTTKQAITEKVSYDVRHSGDGYGTETVQFPTSNVFETYEAAQNYIESIDKDFYGGYAVKFYDFSKVKNTKKIDELEAKIRDTHTKRNEYEKVHSVKNQKAAFIGCSKCGSKLSREMLRSEKCPLCYTDLRANTTLERLSSFDSRVKEYRKKIDEERIKEKKKAEIKWLVKYEYHS